jgi:endo-alpha-1,4-polygalactosaminidase (GH114 family)
MIPARYRYIFILIAAIFSSLAYGADYDLPDGQWRLISLPTVPPENAKTVQAIFGKNIGEGYGRKWILYGYSRGGYQKIGSGSSLEQGHGYWIIQNTGKSVRLQMPKDSSEALNSVETVLLTPARPTSYQWNLVGNPFSSSIKLSDLSVKTDTGVCSGQGCGLLQADGAGIVHKRVWRYLNGKYSVIENNVAINPWEGFWCTTMEHSKNLNRVSLITNKGGRNGQVFSVYNQAYQENFSVDSISEILSDARNAYVLLDPFDNNGAVIENIQNIKGNQNEISGYISVGTGENWRNDYEQLKPYLSTTQWGEWKGEYFVSQTTTGILNIMKSRIDKMSAWGVDWIEFDNMDWLDADIKAQYTLEATVAESKAYVNALCDYAHSKGIKCMAKNTVNGFDRFDGVTYESSHSEKNWWEQQGTRTFLASGKPVIINHYNENNCDAVFNDYKAFYNSNKISFICEDRGTQKYRHY